MRYIILSTIIILLSCSQPSLIESERDMEDFGLNMKCQIIAKYEDKTFFRIYCTDLDDGKVVESDYWNEAIKKNASIRVEFYDEDEFERYEHIVPVTSFNYMVGSGNIAFQGTIKPELLSKEVFDKISKIRLGTRGISERAKY